ncbi:MAG: type II toxin-antitoxin system VapC family toxin [Vulcanimicrobiaceae bacterium]
MITLDTSAVFAIANRRDPDHERVRRVLEADPGPYVVPAGALAEMTFLIEDRLGWKALDAFLADLAEGALCFDCGNDDFARVRELAERYRDLPLGAADASVIACGERLGRRVLTLDRRDFEVVARDVKLHLEPQ